MCMAMSFTRAWKSSLRAAKSVSQLTSTRTPSLAARMNVVADHAFGGERGRTFFWAEARPFFRRIDDGLLHIARWLR